MPLAIIKAPTLELLTERYLLWESTMVEMKTEEARKYSFLPPEQRHPIGLIVGQIYYHYYDNVLCDDEGEFTKHVLIFNHN